MLCISSVFSQNILFKDNFDSYQTYKFGNGWVSSGWKPGIMYLIVGTIDTACLCHEIVPDVISQRRVAGLPGCKGAGSGNGALLSSPRINLSGVYHPILKYESYFLKRIRNGKFEDAYVVASGNGGTNWTMVQTLPANTSPNAMQTYYIDLSLFANMPDVRVGFYYNNNYSFAGGWAIDDIEVFESMPKDLKLVSVTPVDTLKSYVEINKGFVHTFTVQNMGFDTVTTFLLKYRRDNGNIYSDTVNNISIPPLSSYTYSHSIPDTATSLGYHSVTAWLELGGDAENWNDTIHTGIRCVMFIPQKMVLVEEGTGTWHYLSPRGDVYMHQLKNAGLSICQVAVHDTDPMSIEDYNDYLYNLRQIFIPYFLIDRRRTITHDSLIDIVKQEQCSFGFANLTLSSYTYPERLLLKTIVTPATTLEGDFSVLVILTEDDVKGNDSGWAQVNGYANNQRGPMGGYENKPDPVPAINMSYDFVARSIYFSPGGNNNLPHTMYGNQNYTIDFDLKIDPKWDKNNMRAIVLLYRNSDSTILNSNQIPFALTVRQYEQAKSIDAILYPNPTNEQTTLQLYFTESTNASIVLTDISGRTLLYSPEREYALGKNEIQLTTNNLASGIYIVSIISKFGSQNLKLQVLH